MSDSCSSPPIVLSAKIGIPDLILAAFRVQKLHRDIFALQQTLSAVAEGQDVAFERVRQLLSVLGAADDDAVAAYASVDGGKSFTHDDYRYFRVLHGAQ